MHLGKCICQYKQFSTSLEWLPPIADYVPSTATSTQTSSAENQFELLFSKRIFDIEDNYSLSSVEGQRGFQSHLGVPENVSGSELSFNMGNVLEIAGSLQKALPILKRIEERGLLEQELRHNDEAEGYDDRARYLSESDTEYDDNENEENESRNQRAIRQHHDALRSNQKALESLNTKSRGKFMFFK
jgi:hypothetical protein